MHIGGHLPRKSDHLIKKLGRSAIRINEKSFELVNQYKRLRSVEYGISIWIDEA